MNQKEILELLRSSTAQITFTKVNGEQRTMRCTLNESVLPKPTHEDPITTKRTRDISPELLVVWDIEKSAWRSMRWANILEVTDDTVSQRANS
jgi:hypothetical protein